MIQVGVQLFLLLGDRLFQIEQTDLDGSVGGDQLGSADAEQADRAMIDVYKRQEWKRVSR